jgi:Leucine-rich repeat (LRR) protein
MYGPLPGMRSLPLLALLVVLACTPCAATGVAATPASEIASLRALYAGTNGATWTNSAGWSPASSMDPCADAWFGVTCGVFEEAGANVTRVQALSLSGNGLAGDLPVASVWQQLPRLFAVTLSYNALTGTFDGVLSLGSQLALLVIAGNAIGGTLKPDLIGNLTNLQAFYITSNSVEGSIPAEFGLLSKLTFLALSYNKFTGMLPAEIGNLMDLGTLAVGGNQLTGVLPPEWSRLVNLTFFSAEINSFSGCIPSEWASMTKLGTMGIYSAGLACAFPEWIGTLTSLQLLYLHDNAFTGSTALALLCPLSKLLLLTLGQNQLSGGWPSCVWPLMGTLQIAGNLFSGPLPANLGSMSSIKILDLSNNQWTATAGLPRSIANMTQLQSFKISNNPLGLSIDGIQGVNTGGIEPLSLLPSLTVLDLNNCSLRGSMSSLGLNAPQYTYSNVFPSLVYLTLSNNPSLTGTPSGNVIASMTSIQSLDLSNNRGLAGTLNDLNSLSSLIATGVSQAVWSGALPSGIIVDRSVGYVLSNFDNSLSCPQFTGASSAQTWLVDPSYYNSSLCRCSDGFYGTVPNCVAIPATVSFASTPAVQTVSTLPSFLSDVVLAHGAQYTAPSLVFDDQVYGSARANTGMSMSQLVNMTNSALADVRSILFHVSINRTYFAGFNNFLAIYQFVHTSPSCAHTEGAADSFVPGVYVLLCCARVRRLSAAEAMRIYRARCTSPYAPLIRSRTRWCR